MVPLHVYVFSCSALNILDVLKDTDEFHCTKRLFWPIPAFLKVLPKQTLERDSRIAKMKWLQVFKSQTQLKFYDLKNINAEP